MKHLLAAILLSATTFASAQSVSISGAAVFPGVEVYIDSHQGYVAPQRYYRPPPLYYSRPPAYYAPPVYYAPPPVYYTPPDYYHSPARAVIRGHRHAVPHYHGPAYQRHDRTPQYMHR